MDYISTKQAAEKWGISQRRIVMLASEGKIKDAVLMDNRWLIPQNCERPKDARKRTETRKEENGRYADPYPFGRIRAKEDYQLLSFEEQQLYQAYFCYEKGAFEKTKEIAVSLINSTKNPYIRFGALYILTFSQLYLEEFEEMKSDILLFKMQYFDMKNDEKTENIHYLEYIYREFNTELGFKDDNLYDYEIGSELLNDEAMMAMIAPINAFMDLAKLNLNGTMPNIISHEIICTMIEKMGYRYDEMLMHIYLSMIYGQTKNREKESEHMRKALAIGIEEEKIFTLAGFIVFNADSASAILSEYPKEIQDRFAKMQKQYIHAHNAYSTFAQRRSFLFGLSSEDYALISLCNKGYSVEEMAETYHLSRSGMNKRLSKLYKDLNVSSKNELIEQYIQSIKNQNW